MFSVLNTISEMFIIIAFEMISRGLGKNNYRFLHLLLERQIISCVSIRK